MNTVSLRPSAAAAAWRSPAGTTGPSQKTASGFPPEPEASVNTRSRWKGARTMKEVFRMSGSARTA